jgi:cholesterol transport system auxiliary component
MKFNLIKATWSALCILQLSGCGLFSPVNMTTDKSVLDSIPHDLPNEQTRAATLLVLIPQGQPVYDTTQMAYATHAHQIAYFSRNEWAAPPSQMMLPLIVETIRNTRYFSDVLAAPDFGRHTFALRSELLELKQDFTSNPATLKLTMRFYLIRAATDRVIATKNISMSVPMRERTPYAGIVAANEATENVLRALVKFLVEQAV